MNFHSTQQLLKTILSHFSSASLVTEDGKLLASIDCGVFKSTTSRLVVFQIVKKYLNPQIGDLFILNDPGNGGLNYQNVFFTTRVTDKIFLVFVQEMPQIDFKIPPTPLYDKGLKNKTVWPFLVEQNPHAEILRHFFEKNWHDVLKLKNLGPYLSEISVGKNQLAYFRIVAQIFERNFNTKALGQSEVSLKLSATDTIKVRLAIDEKQNQRTIHIDFSQTSIAGKMFAASHVIESAVMMAIAESYGMCDLLSQPLLDLVRLTLPPQSIVSKANPLGTYNLLLQKAVSEQVFFLLTSLAGKSKAAPTTFKLKPEFRIDLEIDNKVCGIHANNKKFVFKDLDYLIASKAVLPLISQQIDGKVHLKLQVLTDKPVLIRPQLILNMYSQEFFQVSNASLAKDSVTTLKQNEIIELNWSLVKDTK